VPCSEDERIRIKVGHTQRQANVKVSYRRLLELGSVHTLRTWLSVQRRLISARRREGRGGQAWGRKRSPSPD